MSNLKSTAAAYCQFGSMINTNSTTKLNTTASRFESITKYPQSNFPSFHTLPNDTFTARPPVASKRPAFDDQCSSLTRICMVSNSCRMFMLKTNGAICNAVSRTVRQLNDTVARLKAGFTINCGNYRTNDICLS